MTLSSAVAHFRRDSWYRQSLTAAGGPIQFIPGPQMTSEQIDEFDSPIGQANRAVRIGYLLGWVAQILAVIGAFTAAALMVTSLISGSQDMTNNCRDGLPGCGDESVQLAGPLLGLLACLAVLILGRRVRRWVAEQMRRSARRNAGQLRGGMRAQVVVIDELPPRSRWLVTMANRMLQQNYPADLAERVLWDIARRLEAAAYLRGPAFRSAGRQQATQLATELSEQAERDVTSLRHAVVAGTDYRHRPPTAKSLSALPRVANPATVLNDAQLLLPRNHSHLEGATS